MFWHDLFFIVMGVIEAALMVCFFSRFTGWRAGLKDYAVFIAVLCAPGILGWQIQSYLLELGFSIFLLVLLGVAHRCKWHASGLAAVLAMIITQLSYGILDAVLGIIAPSVMGTLPWIYQYLGMLSSMMSLLLSFVSYRLILNRFELKNVMVNKYTVAFLFPVLLILMVLQYTFDTVYGSTIFIDYSSGAIQPGVNHWQLLVVLASSALSLFSILITCQKLSDGFTDRMRLALLEQEVHMQKEYLQEASIRYEQTKAFRHDIKNHLMTVSGLLKGGEVQKAEDYLESLKEVSSDLFFHCKTGNAVVDVLLNSKLGTAQQTGVRVECAVKVPASGGLEDLDLCVVFSNGLDNALKACRQKGLQDPYIRIAGKQKGNFFMLEIENSCADDEAYEKGEEIGLRNIENVAKKYCGALTAERLEGRFLLNVLFVI